MPGKLPWREASSIIIVSRSLINNGRMAAATIPDRSRNDQSDFKVLTVMRNRTSSFMPGGYVFPGGSVDATDSCIGWLDLFKQFGLRKEDLPTMTPANAVGSVFEKNENGKLYKALSMRITAIRETFEESGILLCKNSNVHNNKPSNWASFISGHEIEDWQKKVQKDPSEFLKLCKHFNCYPDVWSLQLWSNWLSPIPLPQRFDTAFFIVTIDQIPPVVIDNKEVIGFKWCTPRELLNLCHTNEIWLPPPQYYEVAKLKNFNSIDKLSDFAAYKNTLKCKRWMPIQVVTPFGQISILPGDYLYPTHPVYEGSDIQELSEEETQPENKKQPMHRMEIRGIQNTRLVLKNIPSDSGSIPPWIIPKGEDPQLKNKL